MPSSGAECVAVSTNFNIYLIIKILYKIYYISLKAELCGILSTPVQYRCHRLNTMINAYSPRDLQNIFPQLIDSIFNSRGGQGWGLRLITQSSNVSIIAYAPVKILAQNLNFLVYMHDNS